MRGRKPDDDEADRPPSARRGARPPRETGAAEVAGEGGAVPAEGEPSRAWRRRLEALRGELLVVRELLRGSG